MRATPHMYASARRDIFRQHRRRTRYRPSLRPPSVTQQRKLRFSRACRLWGERNKSAMGWDGSADGPRRVSAAT